MLQPRAEQPKSSGTLNGSLSWILAKASILRRSWENARVIGDAAEQRAPIT